MKNEVKDKQLTLEELLDNQRKEVVNNATASELVSLIAIDNLTNEDKIDMTSRIKEEQVPILVKLDLFAETFGIPFTKRLALLIKTNQVSIRGLGRKELVKVVNQYQSEDNIKRGIFERKEVFR
ncbi:MAG: hypothetical protein QXI16_00540 [Sulfolobaceae archaeon]